MMQVVQVILNDASDKTITGKYDFNRDAGGKLLVPAGTSLPVSGSARELFYDMLNNKLYVCDDNAVWVPIEQNQQQFASSHASLRQLVHLAINGPFESFGPCAVEDTGPFPFATASIWYTDQTRAKKIVETRVSYNNHNMPVTMSYISYNEDGITQNAIVTDTITYTNNVFEASRNRTIQQC